MIENYKLDKSFGPTGSSAGLFLFVAGLILLFFHLSGLILVFLGAFVGFTSTSTLVDYDRKRVKFSNNIFGFVRIGKWINITDEMKIGIKKSDVTWRTYSRSNQSIDIDENDYRLILFDSEGKPLLILKKTSSPETALAELESECARLGISSLES